MTAQHDHHEPDDPPGPMTVPSVTHPVAHPPEAVPAAPALVLSGVSKRFGPTVALDGVDIELAAHELVVLVGPSGCGKSTMLRVVAGLLPADSGRIELGGTLVDDGRHHVPPERRHIGLVFQEHTLFPHLTVARNIAFGLDGTTRAQSRARVTEVLELVGLPEHRDRYPHELSGGERQRVALGRALAPRPMLMLLDEPFASLDANLRSQIRNDVVAILRAARTPAVFVTHDQTEAMALGDRVAVMRSGRIEQLSTPWQVFHQPTSRFVAAFMGEASFLAIDHHGATAASTELGPLEPLEAPIPTDAVAMVRPDDMTFEVDAGGDAEVVAVEFRGPTYCYTLRLRSGAVVQATRSHLVRAEIGARVRAVLVDGHRPVVVRDRR